MQDQSESIDLPRLNSN